MYTHRHCTLNTWLCITCIDVLWSDGEKQVAISYDYYVG